MDGTTNDLTGVLFHKRKSTFEPANIKVIDLFASKMSKFVSRVNEGRLSSSFERNSGSRFPVKYRVNLHCQRKKKSNNPLVFERSE